jgi:hypothetical protein
MIRDVHRRHNDEKARDALLSQIVQVFIGHDADPVTDLPETPGIVKQIHVLRVRQEEIGALAKQTAEDITAIRQELTVNGGTSVKDVVNRAARDSAHNSALLTEHLREHESQG